MLRKIALTAAAFASLGMSATALADHGWWDDDAGDDAYRTANNGAYDRRTSSVSRSNNGYDYADVLDVEPIYHYVRVRVPEQECWDERVQERPYNRHNSAAGATVVGGLIGGAIGRQFGDGNGRDAMTIVGTLLGSAIAHDEAHRNHSAGHYDARARTRIVERCETRYTTREERRIEGYHVTYAYAGRTYQTRTTRDPGNQIRVRAVVRPVKNGRRY